MQALLLTSLTIVRRSQEILVPTSPWTRTRRPSTGPITTNIAGAGALAPETAIEEFGGGLGLLRLTRRHRYSQAEKLREYRRPHVQENR